MQRDLPCIDEALAMGDLLAIVESLHYQSRESTIEKRGGRKLIGSNAVAKA